MSNIAQSVDKGQEGGTSPASLYSFVFIIMLSIVLVLLVDNIEELLLHSLAHILQTCFEVPIQDSWLL